MTAVEIKKLISTEKFVPILRIDNADLMLKIAKAVYASGVKILEYTMTIPGVIDALSKIKSEIPGLTLGLGTVYRAEDARNAIHNGADFIVSPVLQTELVEPVKQEDKLLMLSGFTPTEILAAYNAGSDIVKLFPAKAVHPRYISDIHGPMPFVDILPTGGLSLIDGIHYLRYGAFAVGFGGFVFNKKWIKEGNFEKITQALANVHQRFQKI